MNDRLKKPVQVNADDYRIYVVISFLTYLGITVHALLIPLFFWLGYGFLGVFNVFSTLAWVVARLLNQGGRHASATMVLLVEVGLHTTIALYFIGWHSGFQYYLMAGVPFILFNNKVKTAPLLVTSGFLCFMFIALYELTQGRVYVINHPLALEAMNYANIVISFISLTLTSYYFRVASFISEQQMEAAANTDLLTGLPNRRGTLALLDAQHAFYTRNGTVFSLAVADIDHFKVFNDNYGHACGDDILRQVAQQMKQRLRQYDVVARWGGEEFLFMFPNTNAATATLIAEDIRRIIDARHFNYDGLRLSVTLTFGVAEHQEGASLDATIKQADDALYQGKAAGRNRVVRWLEMQEAASPA